MPDAPTARIRVLLVDDQHLFRQGLATLLAARPEVEVVGEAADGEEALERVAELAPDVVLMDLRMPRMGGVEATARITGSRADTAVLVLTTFDEDDDVFAALRAGARGYLLKDCRPDRLIEAIEAAARGDAYLPPAIAGRVVGELQRLRPEDSDANRRLRESLSERELEVLEALAGGATNRQIARRLHLAEGTVKNYVSSILAKLGTRDRTETALRARDLGLLPGGRRP